MNYRNKSLLRAAQDRPCVMCGSRGTTVACHANWQEFGKGLGLKAHDWAVAYLCQSCHVTIDSGSRHLSAGDRKEMWVQAWIKTVAIWFEEGLVK